MNSEEILRKAAELVGGDRQTTHGDKLKNHETIAKGFQFWLEIRPDPAAPLNAWDASNMMEILKICRRVEGEHNIDDYVDGAGYSGVSGEIAERLLLVLK